LLLVLLGLTLTVLGLFVEVPCPFLAPAGTLPYGGRPLFEAAGWTVGIAPWTLQGLGPWVAGLTLPPVQASLALALWLVACILGAPWAESSRGLEMVTGPAFGFQFGLVVQAVVIAVCVRGGTFRHRFTGLLLGQVASWSCGAAWLALRDVDPWPLVAGQTSGLPGLLVAWAVLAILPTALGCRKEAPKASASPHVIR
jgi:biotin transporter BioY